MPADTVSFWLKPVGFFDRNPSLDVQPSPAGHAHGHHEQHDPHDQHDKHDKH